MDSGSAEILYEWEYELPRGWEQHHDQEGKICFTKSEDGLLTETWFDPRWQDSWDKFQRARQQNKMQIKRPQVILAKQARKPRYRKDRRPASGRNPVLTTTTVVILLVLMMIVS